MQTLRKQVFMLLFLITIVGAMPTYSFAMDNDIHISKPVVSNSEKEVALEAIRVLVNEQGYTRVIIGLAIDFKPEGELTQKEIDEQHEATAETRQRLLAEIKEHFDFALEEYFFETIPYITVNINQKILDFLAQHPLVKTIQLDETIPLSTPSLNMEVIQ
ncbi:MAG: hypothetical protein VSS52_006980 [Thiotrichaceae bacterium]|nr:hypothetical protein [Thiotrichaceae bacterium]